MTGVIPQQVEKKVSAMDLDSDMTSAEKAIYFSDNEKNTGVVTRARTVAMHLATTILLL